MAQYKVIQAFEDLEAGRIYRVGDTYEGEDEGRIKDLLADNNKGRHESLKGKPLIELENEASDFPKHVGGGQYELSDGSKVKGKDAAIEAENALNK